VGSAAKIGTSSYLHVNLSFMPFSYYDTGHPAASYGFSTSCPSAANVRSCFQTILANMRAQGVTGVRIFATFCDSTSQVFANCGSPWTQVSWSPSPGPPANAQYLWLQNVKAFFQDVHAAGIQNVAITFGSSGGSANTFTVPASQTVSPATPAGYNCSQSGGRCCVDTPATVMFNPYVPFGMNPSNGFPIGDYWSTPSPLNQGYNCAPINSQYFLGWTNQFNVINAVLGAAKGLVTVYELETQQEFNTQAFTVLTRYMYDNSMPQSAGLAAGQTVDVVSNLRSLMSANGFDPGRVIWSAVWDDSSVATYNCANVYTDYARNFGLDTVAQAIIGGTIGTAVNSTVTDGLVCGGTATTGSPGFMFKSPVYSTLPDLVDVHMYPAVTGIANTDAQMQQVAALDYGDIPHFLTLASLQSATVVIGETYGGTIYPGKSGSVYCWGVPVPADQTPPGAPSDNVAGFNQSALAAQTVVFRPWMELEDPSGVCFPYGGGPASGTQYQNVNYNGNGPYTPTNR
jgi:hypothetical protein